MKRVVLDTNLFVSGLLVRAGPPAQVLDAWRARRYVLLVSPAIIAEVRRVLRYPRIQQKYGLTDAEIEQLVTLLEQEGLLDEMVLACALDGQADLIVSGDRHLLSLGTYQSIPILTARQFLESL